MSENIDITVREDGSREAAANIRDIGTSADATTANINALNAALATAAATLAQLGQSGGSASAALGSMATSAQSAATGLTNAGNSASTLSSNLAGFAVGAVAFNAVSEAVTNLGGALGDVITKSYDLLQTVVSWEAGADRFAIGMKQISDNSTAAAANTQFVRDTVQNLGVDLATATNGFIKFAAATKGTTLQGQETQKVFTAVTEAASVLHLTTSQVTDTFKALQDMVSKGTVQMQDLKTQLGNDLPGAIQIAARALGVTTQQLEAMTKAGTVITDDFLPKFADQIQKEYAGSLEDSTNSAQASLNRLSSAWTDLERTVGQSAIGKAAQGQLNILTDALNGVSEAVLRAKNAGAGFWGQAGAAAGSVLTFLNPSNAIDYQAQSVEGLKKQVAEWQTQLSQAQTVAQQRQAAERLALAQTNLAKAQQGLGSTADPASTNLSPAQQAAILAQQQSAAVSKFLDSGKDMTSSETLQKRLKEVDDGFKAATAGIQQGSDLYNQALAAATARKQQLWDNYNKPNARIDHSAEQNALSAEITEWQGYADERKQIFDTDQKNLETDRNNGLISQKDYFTKLGDMRADEISDLEVVAQKQADLASGKDSLSVRQKYLNEVKTLQQEEIKSAADTQVQISALYKQTTDTANKAFLSLQQSGVNRDRSNSNALAVLGLGSDETSLIQQIQSIQQTADAARLKMTQQATNAGTLTSSAYIDGIAKLDAEEKAQIEREKGYFAQRDQMQSDWSLGATAALQDYIDTGKNVAAQTKTAFTDAFSGMEDALVTFVTTGKLNFTSLATSILTDLARMEIKIAASAALQSIFGTGLTGSGSLLGNLFGSTSVSTGSVATANASSDPIGSLASSQGWAGGGYTGAGTQYEVAGAVHKGEYVFNQDATNRLGTAQLDALANGAPISSAGSSGSGNVSMNVQIVNNASDKVQATAEQGTDSNGNPTLKVIVDQVEQQIAGRVTSGRGPMYSAIGKSFGLPSKPSRG